MHKLAIGVILISLFCNRVQASSDNGLWKSIFGGCKEDAAMDSKKNPIEVECSAIKALDNKFPVPITNLIIEMLVDPNRYVYFNVNTILENLKKERKDQNQKSVDCSHRVSRTLGLYRLHLSDGSCEAVTLHLRDDTHGVGLEHIVHCICPPRDFDCQHGACKKALQSWKFARKTAFWNLFAKPSNSNISPVFETSRLIVKRQEPDSPIFTIDVIGDIADDSRALIQACGKADPSRFGKFLKRMEITAPGAVQELHTQLIPVRDI